MSYVERAFYDYLKSVMFGGIRILLSRRMILFSVILFLTSLFSTGLVVIQGQNSSLVTPELLRFIFVLQISIAIGLILSGLVSKKLNLILRFLLLLILVIVVQAFYLLSQGIEALAIFSDLLIQLFPLFTFFSWALLVPLASFAFSKGMFSNKITGSILFLGKPRSDQKSIFSGIMALIAFLSIIWNLIITYLGFTQNHFSYSLVGIFGTAVGIIVILCVRGWIFTDDVFNTSIGFFFIMTLPNQIMIFFTSVSGSENIITSFDFILVTFSLLYSAQNISRRIKMKGVVHDPTIKSDKQAKEDPFRIGRFIGFVGGEGVVLIYLGLALGFHLIQLQILSGYASVYETLFGGLDFSEAYHDITLIFMVIILLVVMAFYTIQRGGGYWESEIYRFDFLPPYDNLVDYLERLKTGEITKTDLVITAGKKAMSAGSVGIFAAARKFRDRIFGDND
ncbi:MAG: hypothetical protein EAX86_07330 [Candidatus Heimdallarchaeota archaeon]|nr:hypothetical protein [Candidatus Heimdallarchaeota archaeon]